MSEYKCGDCVYFPYCGCYGFEEENARICENFKNKANLVELPCKIGDEVWCIRTYNGHKSHAQKGKVTEMYFADDMRLVIHIKHIGRGFWGERVFATEEEALENIMKEGNENA